MRIPGSSTTIGEKLEKYNSAVQVLKSLGMGGMCGERKRHGLELNGEGRVGLSCIKRTNGVKEDGPRQKKG